jgi:hypothetical protein
MKTYYRIVFLTLVSLLIFSCGEKEDPNSEKSLVKITGFDLELATAPSGRMSAASTWNHIYPQSLSIQFTNLETAQVFDLTFNPNDLSTGNQIELNLGSYSYSGKTALAEVASFLPIEVSGTFAANSSDISLELKAKTTYSLLTFSSEELKETPKILSVPGKSMDKKDRFFYNYFPAESLVKVELTLKNGESFRKSTRTLPFVHHHHFIKPSGSTATESFLPTDFVIDFQEISLGVNGKPLNLSPAFRTNLPENQSETSGLEWINGSLYSINDGGNTNQIFELNPQTGEVKRAIQVINATNTDWEDMAKNETHLFIGDFGNNTGNRKDLKIWKIPLSDLASKTEVTAQEIRFHYPQQTDFSGSNSSHNFDCEALLVRDNQLHLFTKNWENLETDHYTLPVNPGNYAAEFKENLKVDGLITGAALSPSNQEIVLLGYENRGVSSQCFTVLLSEFSSNSFFTGKMHRLTLGSPLNLSQTEGVVFDPFGTVLISGERISTAGVTLPARLSEIDLKGLF